MAKLTHNQTKKNKPRVVIVGGGFGGLELAKNLRRVEVEVVLFDKYNHHTFQPLLYQVATSGLETSAIVYPFRKRFKRHKDFYFRLGEVKHINAEENLIETSIGSMKYDFLVIATGATTNYYGKEDIEKNAVPMKTIQDAIKLRNKIIQNCENALLTEEDEKRNSYMDFVIVGGGPTGVELAGALAELKNHVFPEDYKELNLYEMDIDLIEATDSLLSSMSKEAGQKSKEFLEKMGVRIHLNTMVESYDGYKVVFENGKELITRNLIWAAGVRGTPIEGLEKAEILSANRLSVDDFNRVKGYENIFAIGDVAAMVDEDNPKGHPMVAPTAIQQGKLLAKNIKSILNNQPLKIFQYLDKGSMATVGRNKAVVDIKKFKTQGWFAWFIWMFVHLMSLVGFRNRIFVFFSWVWSYFTYDKSNRLIIGKLGTNNPEAKDKVKTG